MVSSCTRTSLVLATAIVCTACAVVEPLGWPTEKRTPPTRRITATPGVMYGYAPLSWDLPDGRTIVVDVDELQLPPLARAAEATFTVGYRDAPGHAVRCSSGLAPGAEGWFRCWGVDARDQPIHFDLGAGNDCELSVARHIDTYTTPACWKGRARVAGTEIQLDRGYFERSGMIVGYASWVDGTQPLFAANIVGEQQIQLHDGPSALHPADADLLLLTVALHWFEQATDQ